MTNTGIMPAMTGLKIQRSKFVNANTASALRPLAVQTPNPPEKDFYLPAALVKLSDSQSWQSKVVC
jgi:hypothetical protein